MESPGCTGAARIFWQSADGSGGLERLTSGEESGNQVPKSFSANGQMLAFHHASPSTRRDVYVLQMADRQVVPFLRTPFTEGAPEFSPDGRWIAYVSDESGRPEIYVQPYPGRGGSGKFQPNAAPSRCGDGTGENSSTGAAPG